MLFSFSKSKAIQFSKLPLLIQERFAELCDAKTLSTFSRINHRTKWLSRKRKIVENITIHIEGGQENGFGYSCCANKDEFCSTFEKHDKYYEAFNLLNVWSPKVTEEDVKGILKTYSSLTISSNDVEFNVFKHLLNNPKLEDCKISFNLPKNMETGELREKLQMLRELLIPINRVQIHINVYDNKGVVDLVRNELMKLSQRPTPSTISKTIYDSFINVSTLDRTHEHFSKFFYKNAWISDSDFINLSVLKPKN